MRIVMEIGGQLYAEIQGGHQRKQRTTKQPEQRENIAVAVAGLLKPCGGKAHEHAQFVLNLLALSCIRSIFQKP